MPPSRSMHFCASASGTRLPPSWAGSKITPPSTSIESARRSRLHHRGRHTPSRADVGALGRVSRIRPVRIGNAAVSQFQGDIYGGLMDAFYLSNKYVSPTSCDVWVKVGDRLEWICENWHPADAGIQEERFSSRRQVQLVLLRPLKQRRPGFFLQLANCSPHRRDSATQSHRCFLQPAFLSHGHQNVQFLNSIGSAKAVVLRSCEIALNIAPSGGAARHFR